MINNIEYYNEKEFAVSMGISADFNVVLNLILIPYYVHIGVYIALFGSVIMFYILILLMIKIETPLLNLFFCFLAGAFIYGISLIVMKSELVYYYTINKLKHKLMFCKK